MPELPDNQASFVQLALKLADGDAEVARAAKRTMWKIVRNAGRPDAGSEAQAVAAELTALLRKEKPPAVHREVLWMLAEIASDKSVPAIVTLLSQEAVREDARMSLERIPGSESLAALRSALDTVPDSFKVNIAQSLRARGEDVAGFPCQKLKPTKQTKVTAK